MKPILMKKSTILERVKTSLPEESEELFNPYYAIGKAFTEKELNEMTEVELNNLVRLSRHIQRIVK